MIAATKRTVRYSSFLTGIELIWDASGLVTGVNNSFGEVDGSNNIVSVKSLAPGPTGRDFNVQGTGVTFDPTTKSIAANGSGNIRCTSAASVFNFLNFHASGLTSLKWTAFIVCKIGNVLKPSSVVYGLFGNNGGSTTNRGAQLSYINNATNEDTLQPFVSLGSAGNYIGRLLCPGSGPSNQYCVITVVMDGNEINRMRMFVNDQAILYTDNLNTSSTPSSPAAFALEFFAAGNAATRMIGNIKEVIITSTAVSFDNTITVIRQLMNKHNIVRTRTSDYLDKSVVTQIYQQDIGTIGFDYFLCSVLSQNPVAPNIVFSAYSVGPQHTYNSTKKLAGRKSIYKGVSDSISFDAEVGIYDPAGADSVQDCGGGFDQNGIMHLFCDVINSSSAGGCVAARHIYSSDLVSWTNTDITASLAADGLLAWRMYGNMIHAGGVWIKPYYKFTDHGSTANSALYVLRSTDGINFTSVTVKASSATYINEASIVHLGGNNMLIVARNDDTGEWNQYLSTDLGLNWTDQGAVTFGETVVSANPCMLKSFMLNGSLVIVAYITNRNNDTAFAIYALPANLVSSGVSGWDLDTKLMWWKTSLAPKHYHYCDFVQIDNTLRAIAGCPLDEFPGAGSGTANVLNYTTVPTFHVANIETQLGI